MDSSHAADLTFEFTVKNTGTEYARELSGIVVNVYLGDDTSPPSPIRPGRSSPTAS